MIVLITPTGGRPKQFKLCMEWMKNQTYTGKVLWIVVDDCEPMTTDSLLDNFRENWSIVKKYPKPVWRNGDNTQSRNLRVAINTLEFVPKEWIEAIFIIEDDDYYKPDYLEKMLFNLKGFEAIGQTKTIYYNLFYHTVTRNKNDRHSSLFQIAFTPIVLPIFEECLNHKFIDISFCKKLHNMNLFDGIPLSIGMKGLPGRAGIGVGHKMRGVSSDINNEILKKLIGDDFKFYL
jgi:hypothetical protein